MLEIKGKCTWNKIQVGEVCIALENSNTPPMVIYKISHSSFMVLDFQAYTCWWYPGNIFENGTDIDGFICTWVMDCLYKLHPKTQKLWKED